MTIALSVAVATCYTALLIRWPQRTGWIGGVLANVRVLCRIGARRGSMAEQLSPRPRRSNPSKETTEGRTESARVQGAALRGGKHTP